MEIEITDKTEEEIKEIKENYPDGHRKNKENKVYWVFESKVEYGV